MLPETISPSINVDAVVLGSEAMKEARNFNRYLLSRSAQATLAQFGYQAPAK
jgi:ABC-type molybdate transport system substrate-binding protein